MYEVNDMAKTLREAKEKSSDWKKRQKKHKFSGRTGKLYFEERKKKRQKIMEEFGL